MKLSIWRTAFRTWLEAQVTIDNWSLDVPETPGVTTALLPPIRYLAITLKDQTEAEGILEQDIYLVKRYSSPTAYVNLPLATLEGLYQTLAIRLTHDYRDILEDITQLELLPNPDPIVVRPVETEERDWLLELHWTIRVYYLADPEVGAVQPPFDLREIILGIRRSELADFTKNKLDLEVTIDVDPSTSS